MYVLYENQAKQMIDQRRHRRSYRLALENHSNFIVDNRYTFTGYFEKVSPNAWYYNRLTPTQGPFAIYILHLCFTIKLSEMI